MNIVNTLTLRHVAAHKKRSVLTLLAVIVSVAMVTAVFTAVYSFIEFMKDDVAAADGSWHVQFGYEGDAPLDYFRGVEGIEYCVSGNIMSLAPEGAGELLLESADETVVDLRNIQFAEGSFPKSENEILLTDRYLEDNRLDWKVGGTYEMTALDYRTGEQSVKSFTLAGIALDNVSYFQSRDAVTLRQGGLSKNNMEFVTVRFDKLDSETSGRVDTIRRESGAVQYRTSELYQFSGFSGDKSMLAAVGSFLLIILAIIVFTSVFMIRNSFAVSYREREKYLGMLASVGATGRQKRGSVYFEGLIFALIGIPLGIGAGVLGIAVTFKAISGYIPVILAQPTGTVLRVRMHPLIIAGTVAVSALTIFISCLIPARRASRVTPIVAIRSVNTGRRISAKRLRTPKIWEKLFGFEGALAAKNRRRDPRTGRNITFALAMSVVLFISVTTFSMMFEKMVTNAGVVRTPDLYVDISGSYREDVESFLDSKKADDRYSVTQYPAQLSDRSLLLDEEWNSGGGEVYLEIRAYDDKTFDAYVKKLGLDPDGLRGSDGIRAVFVDPSSATGYKRFADATGRTISVWYQPADVSSDSRKTVELEMTVAAVAQSGPEVDGYAWTGLIVSGETFYSVFSLEDPSVRFCVFTGDYRALETQLKERLADIGAAAEIYNAGAMQESRNAVLTIAKVFIYGFIALLTLIAVMNIVNSISNSMNERRTEFAMIRSVGMSPKGLRKMIYLENLGFGLVSLLWAFPVSAALHALMCWALSKSERMRVPFEPQPLLYLAAGAGALAVIAAALLYSSDKIRNDNITEELKKD
ncbi:MAG: ABC transporter permease [Clostridiales bacterium]|nr:ABC transporter permease [Clostridiales bacterium]